MALSESGAARTSRLAGFSLTTPDAHRLAAFYEQALGFRRLGAERREGAAFERLMGVTGGADIVTIALGRETVELVQFDVPGRPYPRTARACDLIFQHFAIVAVDVRRAWRRLSVAGGWTPITTGGPVGLPAWSGGVTAFKFRDPDGHPLELLGFPPDRAPRRWMVGGADPDQCLGIDHSAISVSDTARSAAFYAALGLRFGVRTLNHGPAQDRLDDVPAAVVEVTALVTDQAAPHLELLAYRNVRRGGPHPWAPNDVATTLLMLEIGPSSDDASVGRQLRRDPDGHVLLLAPER